MHKSYHPLYPRWKAMHKRCRSLNDSNYPRYGGRGIKVCPAWYDFWTYVEDIGQCPSPGLTLDRIDNDGNYEPSNIRWATQKQQANNRGPHWNRRYMTLNGVTHTQAEWSRIIGIPISTINNRRMRGWSDERILTTPMQPHGTNQYSHRSGK